MNRRENVIAKSAEADGWEVCQSGWPDFMLYKEETNEVIFVEVKSIPTKYELKHKKPMGGTLAPNQRRVHDIFKNLGLPIVTVHVK